MTFIARGRAPWYDFRGELVTEEHPESFIRDYNSWLDSDYTLCVVAPETGQGYSYDDLRVALRKRGKESAP